MQLKQSTPLSTQGEIMIQLRGRTYRALRSNYQYYHWEVMLHVKESHLPISELARFYRISDKPGWFRGKRIGDAEKI